MTLQQFIAKYKDQRVYFDNAFGAQCMDLYRQYVKEVWRMPQTPGVVGAYKVFDTLPAGFEKIVNKPHNFPQPGDVVVWDEGLCPNGHIGMATEGATIDKFSAFQQNAPKSDVNGITGSPGNIGKYNNYNHVRGWFRPLITPPTPMPEYPIEVKVKVVINSPIPWTTAESMLAEVRQWYKQFSQDKLDPLFTVVYSNFQNVKEHFFVNPDGSAVMDPIWFNTNVMDVSYNNTIFVLRDEDMPDPPPGGGNYKLVGRTQGTPGQQPTGTVITCTETEQSPSYPAVKNFVDLVRHELMHSCYIFAGGAWIIGTNGQRLFVPGGDLTHKYFFLPTWPPPNTGLGQPEGAFNPEELEYPNIYQLLTIQQGDPMILFYNFDDSPTQYILVGDDTLVGTTAAGKNKLLKGRPSRLVTLPRALRANYVISDSVNN